MLERARKLRDALGDVQKEIDAFKAEFPSHSAEQAAISQSVLRRVNPLLALLSAAFVKTEEIKKAEEIK